MTKIKLYQKKKDFLLYKASQGDQLFFLKAAPAPSSSVRQALRDEFETLHALSHPGIPAYYWLQDSVSVPDTAAPCLVLCMEDCGSSQIPFASLSPVEILSVIQSTGQILSWLLDRGILYTDLNPANLILKRTGSSSPRYKHVSQDQPAGSPREIYQEDCEKSRILVRLLDFTYCYYFLRNPSPEYPLRFSYDLSPDLKGQQLLIQELGFLLQELTDIAEDMEIPSVFYELMETGIHPSSHLNLSDYLSMLTKARDRQFRRISMETSHTKT